MEKKSIFNKIILFLCFVALVVNAVETNQIRLQTKSPLKETLIQKIMYNFPEDIKSGQKYINKDKLEFTIKDKNITEKISAPVVKVRYDYWGDAYNENKYYTAKDENNRLVYSNINVKSLFNKKTNLNDLIQAKVVYNEKYEFDCFIAKLTKDKSDFITDIDLMPLQSEDVYFIAEMPKDFVNTKNPINLELLVGNNKYVMKLR